MKNSFIKNLCRCRTVFICVLLVWYFILFSGFILHDQDFFVTYELQFLPAFMSLTLLPLLLIAALTAFAGRLYCSWICPLGLLQELIVKIKFSIFRKKTSSMSPKSSRVLHTTFFVLLAVLFFCGIALPLGYLEPYSLFGKISTGVMRQLFSLVNCNTLNAEQNPIVNGDSWYLYLIICGTALFILLILSIWADRIFCNTLCPAGFILGAISAISKKRLVIDNEKCVKCRKCENSCRASCIDINQGKIDFAKCLMCMECSAICPVNAIRLTDRYKNFLAQADIPQAPERRNMLIAAGITGVTALTAGKILKKHTPAPADAIVPPGGGSVEKFLSSCTGCGLCIANCRGGCLQAATTEYGIRGFLLPTMKFTGSHPGKCEYLCNNCTANCPTGALKKMTLEEKKLCRIGMAKFHPDLCIALVDNEPCGACAEHCPTGALKMVKSSNGKATVPKVIHALCIGCGNCQYACPVSPLQAIRVNGVKEQKTAVAPEEYYKKEEVKTAPSSIPF